MFGRDSAVACQAVIGLVLLACLLSGCKDDSGSPGTSSSSGDATSQDATAQQAALGGHESSIAVAWAVRPGVGVGPLVFGMTRAEATRMLGEPESEQPRAGGASLLTYPSRGVSLGLSDAGRVESFTMTAAEVFPRRREARTFEGRTPEGIGMGVSEKRIREAYGDSLKVEPLPGGRMLRSPDLGISFVLVSDRLVKLTIWVGPLRQGPASGNPNTGRGQ